MSSEMLHLEWDHFRENLTRSIENFKETDFSDVILACQDRQVGEHKCVFLDMYVVTQVMSHKLVLAASSPLFHEMLVKHPHSQPLIFLKGVEYLDLKALLSFMYSGEVELEQGRLDSFLQLGQEFQVKGLTKEEAMPQRLTSISNILEDSDVKWSAKKKRKGITGFPDNFKVDRPLRSPGHQKDPDCQEMHAMQMRNRSISSSSTLSSSQDAGANSSVAASKKNQEPSEENSCPVICTQGTLLQVLKGLSESKQRVEPASSGVGCGGSSLNASSLRDKEVGFPELSCSEDKSEGEHGSGIDTPQEQCYPGNFPDFVEESKDVNESKTTFRCKLCKKTKLHRTGLIEHIESAHFPGTFVHTCKFCDKTLKTKSTLNSHLHSCKNRFFQVSNNNSKHKS